MPAAPKNLYIEQGATFATGFFWHHPQRDAQGNLVRGPKGKPVPGLPYDLTNWRGRMQIRQSVGAPPLVTATTAEATDGTEGAQIVFGLDPDNPNADPDPENGRIDILFDDEATDTLTVTTAKYDLKVYDPQGREHRLLEGQVTISPAMTRDE